MKDFNKSLKKTTSPYHKWAYIEGLACFLKGADDDLNYFIRNPLPLPPHSTLINKPQTTKTATAPAKSHTCSVT